MKNGGLPLWRVFLRAYPYFAHSIIFLACSLAIGYLIYHWFIQGLNAYAEIPNMSYPQDQWIPWVGTPIEEAIPSCRKAANYYRIPPGAVIGVIFGESSFIHFPRDAYNPAGIMNGANLRKFSGWQEFCDNFAHLLRYNYFGKGYDKPDARFMYRYVGYRSDSWLISVRKYWLSSAGTNTE